MLDALDIGYAIKDQRTQLGMTQAQVAEAAGVSKRCLWSLELGQNPGVQLNKLTAILKVLGLDLRIVTAQSPSSAEQNSREEESASMYSAAETTSKCNATNTIDALAILTGQAR